MPQIQDLIIIRRVGAAFGEVCEVFAREDVGVDVKSHITRGQPEIYSADAGDSQQGFPLDIEIYSVVTTSAINLYYAENDSFAMILPAGTELIIDLSRHQVDMLADDERDCMQSLVEH